MLCGLSSAVRQISPSLIFCAEALVCSQTPASALQLTLNWGDTSTNEDGFKVERKAGTTGTFAQLATVRANVVSYTDTSVTGGATHCYRVRAYNTAGDSAYSNEACGTATQQSYSLIVTKTGTGSGTVTSSPSGINCGSICSASYQSGTVVTLSVAPTTGSTFAGWSGDPDCADGSVTMTVAKTCTATFTLHTFAITMAKIPFLIGILLSKRETVQHFFWLALMLLPRALLAFCLTILLFFLSPLMCVLLIFKRREEAEFLKDFIFGLLQRMHSVLRQSGQSPSRR